MTVERANLLAVARTAAAGFREYAALFPGVLARSLKLRGTWTVAAELFDAAVPALRARGDRAALARTLTDRADLLAQRDHAEAGSWKSLSPCAGRLAAGPLRRGRLPQRGRGGPLRGPVRAGPAPANTADGVNWPFWRPI
ncbi:hypothetical protein [Streptomyces broussonetiae]|uniref:Uncharacterized protein n=1 Tax=Streptomyces broussonetiae TaxID=2686304 RepID=A0ABV5EE51_9ACTN